MNIWERENGGPTVAGHPRQAGALGPAILRAETRQRADESTEATESPALPEADETVFTVLAGRARTHATAHLWLTAGIGGIDAAALMIGRPALWWIAAACAAVTAYAVWGLADRALANADPAKRWTRRLYRVIMSLALVAGVACTLAAAIGFLGVALGKSPPTG